jgi:uncharacterized integral membrane protein (TIGR00698 family)
MPLRLATPLAVLACTLFGPWFAQYAGTVLLGNARSPFSGVMGAILAGMVIGNLRPQLASDGAVLKSCTVWVLRVGIVLLGLRLSLAAAIGLGLHALPVVLICITTALLLVTLASRAMAMSPQLAALIAVGTSICGVTAIVATAPVIRAREAEVSYAVACIAQHKSVTEITLTRPTEIWSLMSPPRTYRSSGRAATCTTASASPATESARPTLAARFSRSTSAASV